MTQQSDMPPQPPRRGLVGALIPVGVIILGAGIVLWALKGPDSRSRHGHPDSTVPIEVGATLPDFRLQKFQGDKIMVSELPNKILMINFWATWCTACLVEIPTMLALRNSYKDQGFEIIAINVDDNPEKVIPPVLKRFGIDFPVFLDTDGELTEFFNVVAIPLTVIIDNKRRILFIESGERDWNGSDIRAMMDKWLQSE